MAKLENVRINVPADTVYVTLSAVLVVTTTATARPRYALSALPIILGMTGLSVVGVERVHAIRSRVRRAVGRHY